MSRSITVEIHVTVPDGVDPRDAADSMFDLLCEKANDDLVDSVDGWDVRERIA